MTIKTRLFGSMAVIFLLIGALFLATRIASKKETSIHKDIVNTIAPAINQSYHLEEDILNLRRLELDYINKDIYRFEGLQSEIEHYYKDTDTVLMKLGNILDIKYSDRIKKISFWWKAYKATHVKIISFVDKGKKEEALQLHRGEETLLNNDILPFIRRFIHDSSEMLETAVKREERVDKETRNWIYGFFILVLALAVIINLGVLRFIFKGLSALRDGTDAISKGRLSYRVGLKRSDEIGKLIGAFNAMAQRLEDYNREVIEKQRKLSTLHAVSTALNTSYDLKVSLLLALNRILKIFKLPAGCVYLIEEDEETLSLFEHVGFNDNLIKKIGRISLKNDRNCVVRAVVEKRFVSAKDPQNRDELCEEINDIAGFDCFLAAPIIFKDKAVGALKLFTSGLRELKRSDKEMLQSIVAEFGGALQNYKLVNDVLRAKRQWEETFDALTDMVYLIDTDRNVIRVNKALSEKLGISVKDIIGRKCYEVGLGKGGHCPLCPVNEVLKTGRASVTELEITGLKGFYKKMTYPIFNQEGSLWATVNILKDITHEKNLEAQLLQSEKLMSIGELVSGVAHELNNPLTSVLGYADLLMLRSDVRGEIKKDIMRIKNEGERAAKIIKNLLSFARQKKPEKTLNNINSVIEETFELREYDLKMSKIKVVKELQGNMPSVPFDPMQLTQVFLNLINNAEQAMHEANRGGTLIVRTRYCKPDTDYLSCRFCTEKNEPAVVVEFEDNGPGIPKNLIKNIFDPFFTTKEPGKGTGLGLSVSYGIVAKHGGLIYAENTSEGGSRFVIELPVKDKELKEEIDREKEREYEKEEVKVGEKTVLIVEDEDSLREYLKTVLVGEGCVVDAASSGRKALTLIAEKDYDLIITDYKMPDINGRELYEKAVGLGFENARKFVFATGDVVNEETRSFINESGRVCLEKPYSINDIKSMLKKFFMDSLH